MTGYGKTEHQLADKKLIVEIRSLNSKSLDLSMRVAPALREKELDIRQMIAQRLERGKIDVAVYFQTDDNTTQEASFTPINKEAFRYYYNTLRELRDELGMPAITDLVSSVMRMPDVTKAGEEKVINASEWDIIKSAIHETIDAFLAFRKQEGAALEKMFTEKLDGIATLLAEVEPFEKGRVEKIRQHLLCNLDKLADETKKAIDSNRLEQEMIYYLEKLDITEEKVRLTNHIRYFRETMQGDGTGVGKKLGFIAQEMGREINTLGSKSNQSEMQIIVVKMKDILEQIKEQVLNVL